MPYTVRVQYLHTLGTSSTEALGISCTSNILVKFQCYLSEFVSVSVSSVTDYFSGCFGIPCSYCKSRNMVVVSLLMPLSCEKAVAALGFLELASV